MPAILVYLQGRVPVAYRPPHSAVPDAPIPQEIYCFRATSRHVPAGRVPVISGRVPVAYRPPHSAAF